MLSKVKQAGLIVLLGWMVLGLGINAEDVTSGSSAGNETTSTSNELAGFSQAVLKEEITKASDNLDSSNTQLQFTGNNTLHVKVDSSGTENFSEAGQTKTCKHFITWDEGDLFGYFCMGYLKITFDSNVVEADHVTSGAFSTGISRRGTGWIIVDPWMWYYEGVPASDPNRLAFSITWKSKQAGTSSFTYSITNSSGTIIRNYFLTGTVHNMQAVPAVVDFAPQIQPPAAPSNLVATAVSSSQINLTWQDNSNNEDGYIIESKTSCHDPFVQIAVVESNPEAPAVTYSHTNLSPGTVHYYRIKAYNVAGNSVPSNMAAAVTFAHIPTIDETITELNNVKAGIIKPGLYQSFSDRLNEAKSYLIINDYKSALGPLNSIAKKLAELTDAEMTAEARTAFGSSLAALIDYLTLLSGLPTTVDLYLVEGGCSNVVHIETANGIISTTLSGSLKVSIEPTSNADIASVTIISSAYKGTPIIVNGTNFGKLDIANNTEALSVGTLNLKTGEIVITYNVIVKSDLLVTGEKVTISLKGTFSPLGLNKGIAILIGEGTLPATVPLLGGAKFNLLAMAGGIEALVLKIELVTKNNDGEIVPVGEYLPVSDPTPEITLNDVQLSDVSINANGIISLIVSGTVRDPLADILTNGQGRIASVKIFANGEQIAIAQVTGQSEAPSYFRPFAWKGTFTAQINFPAANPDLTDSNIIFVEAENIIGNAGSDSLTIITYLDETGLKASNITANTGSLTGDYYPLMVEISGNKQAALSGNIAGNFFNQDWNIIPISYSPEHYLLGKYKDGKGNQQVFVVVKKLPEGVDVATIKTPVQVTEGKNNTLEAKLVDNEGDEIAKAEVSVIELELIITHKSKSQNNCPKLNEEFPVYCIVKLREGKDFKYYYKGEKPTAEDLKDLKYWDKKSYIYEFKSKVESRNIQLVDKLTIPIDKLDEYPNKIEYKWFEISASRDPDISNKIPSDPERKGHSGVTVRYAANPIAGWDKWKHLKKFTQPKEEGCHYYFAKVTLYDDKNKLIMYSKEFPDNSVKLTGATGKLAAMYEANARIKFAHKVLCGGYAGNERTIWEWARTHLGLPYGLGAKDKYVNEDCSGLVCSAGLQSGLIPQGEVDIWSVADMVDMAKGIKKPKKILYQVGEGEGATTEILLQKLREIDTGENGPIQQGDLIAHGKSWATPSREAKYPSHIVIVETIKRDILDRITEIVVIESVGYDDMDDAEDRINQQAVQLPKNGTECTRRTDYIATYLNLKGKTFETNKEKPYIGKFWVLRFGEKPKKK
ncbi:MAG: fibronectin type III domain-containing protein [Planctomycetes bacterium]|nr:fibronectin type III domain-containing protein [Planctomycetota bacterium]